MPPAAASVASASHLAPRSRQQQQQHYQDIEAAAGRSPYSNYNSNSNHYSNHYSRSPARSVPSGIYYGDDQSTELTMDTYDQQLLEGNRNNTTSSSGGHGGGALSTVKHLLTKPFSSNSHSHHKTGERQPIVYSHLPVQTNHNASTNASTNTNRMTNGGTFTTNNTANNKSSSIMNHERSHGGPVDTDQFVHFQNHPTTITTSSSYPPESVSLTGNGNGNGVGKSQDSDDMTDAELRKKTQDDIRHQMEYGIGACLLAMAVYIGISIFCFSYWLERWSIVDSVYFAVVTFTTIGYGDLAPDTTSARIFTCVWALSGVACLGIALGVLGSQLLEVAEQEQEKAKAKQREEVMGMISNNSNHNSKNTGNNNMSHFAKSEDEKEPNTNTTTNWFCHCIKSPKTRRFVLVFGIMLAILGYMSVVEKWYPWTALYYGLITASTVGYGDLSPHTQTGRILAIVYIPMAVGVVGSFLDAIANAILERKRKATEDYLESKQLTLQDLKMMDYNGDGKVTLAEFYEFTLIAMGQVDRDTMDHLKERFNKLDKDNSGALDKDDLVELAENNIATTTTSNNPYRYNPNAKTKKHEQLEQKLMARGSSALAYKQYPRNHP